jgi:excisionase family DNA binding protein
MTTSTAPAHVTPAAELLDVRAVAALLGCSARHVYRLSDAGRMPPPIKLGALVRWSRRAITEWVEGDCRPIRP